MKKGTVNFGEVENFILFGGGRILAKFAEFLKSKKVDVVVYSAKRHLEEMIEGQTVLENFLSKEGIRFYSSNDINKEEKIEKDINKNTIGIGFGPSWPFEKEFAKMFSENHLMDFMSIDLPRYRGGAHYTWQILHNNKKDVMNLQIVEGGIERYHKGKIVKRAEYDFSQEARTPQNYFNETLERQYTFLLEFFKEIKEGNTFELTPLSESESVYYPFLNTLKQGYIDWKWGGEEICRFIDAFGDPYAGASTFIGETRVFLKNAQIVNSHEKKFHPFSAGIIYRINKEGMFVCTRDSCLLIKSIQNEKGAEIKDTIKLGSRLFTPNKYLESALTFAAEYNANGLKEK